MSSNVFGRFGPESRGTRSFYEQLRSRDDDDDNARDDEDVEQQAGIKIDEDNLRHALNDFNTEDLGGVDSRITIGSGAFPRQHQTGPSHSPSARWKGHDEDIDNDVPASLLVENNDADHASPSKTRRNNGRRNRRHNPHVPSADPYEPRTQAQWASATAQQPLHTGANDRLPTAVQPRSLTGGRVPAGPKEKAMWRWVNTSNLDSFMRDVYDYFDGGGLWCILCSNALWLMETLFVTVLLTFLTQCVDYSKVPHSKSLDQVVIPQCTGRMSGFWSLAIWLYSFFFIWKSVQYFFEIRRLSHVRSFFIHLLDIPEQDMQTVSWQDVVARIMALRDQNPKTATNIPRSLRRFMGSQSKERLDAHDIANRLMRKENYLIAMINKDLLDLSLPFPLLRNRHLFSRTMEWNLQFCVLDMVFNELGQVQQDFLRADRRGVLSKKLRQRFFFAGCLNLVFAPIVLAYVVIVYFFTYYNEYQKDPKLATAHKYTRLAEWKFREFNELPHIFYERIHMSIPFATRYVDQFPKRMTEDIARSIAFMTGALAAVLAVLTVFDSELFLGFEITQDRTVLFYLGIFGAIWALSRGMVSDETAVFNPEYAIRNVAEYTHYMPEHWEGRLHSFEVKQEFAELFKMRVIIFLEEVMGIITTSLLLLITLPKCSDQIVDFFREFTIHVDGLGYICSFAEFDFKKGMGDGAQQGAGHDVREDYYSTKHGKMAASYYGFLDNYVINPKTGIPGHIPPAARHSFQPPPAFPGLNSPTLAAEMQSSHFLRPEGGRTRDRMAGGLGPQRGPPPAPSPMASMLLDPHHQPSGVNHNGGPAARSLYGSVYPRGGGGGGFRGDSQIIEEGAEVGVGHSRRLGPEEDGEGDLGESAWQTSPGQGLGRENSAANADEPEAGVLGMIYQLRQTQRNRRGAGMI
ncbi:autophagy-related protein 9 [Geosmithia morbida]|uniref:Autophagy-related protein 9 n=1 Tax=Geosmithia morbida TaxID=1094350 RepID=A0A9P4YTU7_9HYPO|nr:autophagy-related protein 9 [Geosmithia morbida]KAF4121573.1 autophagy-related protein 9 [Geosmithia morbida]